LGVPVQGLVALAFGTLGLSVIAGQSLLGNGFVIGGAALGYGMLRAFAKFARTGWEEAMFFPLEQLFGPKHSNGQLAFRDSELETVPPDTLEESDLIAIKEQFSDRLKELKAGERATFICSVTSSGAKLQELTTSGRFSLVYPCRIGSVSAGLIREDDHLYSLHQLPVVTDPLWLFTILSRLEGDFRLFISIRGLDFNQIKRRVELSRRGNSHQGSGLSNVDSDISFEESSHVLRGLSRGDESIVELSLLIASSSKQKLDEALFCEEKNKLLAVSSILGVRRRYHRSHYVRAVTASDLFPNILDPIEDAPSVLTTLRERPLYFSPQDPRLEALHWLVVGSTGSGKSFFTGTILRRMVHAGTPMSVLFVDHNRSFRRVVRAEKGLYLEPKSVEETEQGIDRLCGVLNRVGAMSGIELSDLLFHEKKAATHALLSGIEAFLRRRNTVHPVYIVLDECWNFMRDEPVLVQRAFREFRKLNGAAVAITQSLSDFLSDQSGQSIFQNAPIRILLRQGEDLGRYQGILNLNSVELSRVRLLKQRKGSFSECLVKTPFLSRIGRLYPSHEEHEHLRTDNLRAELIAESNARRST
jgi:hypothetical protein